MKMFLKLTILLTLLSSQLYSQVRIRSAFINSPGGDNGNQFIEIQGPPGQSLNNYYLLEIEGDGAQAGVVERVTNLSAYSLGSKGLLLWRENNNLAPAPSAETTVITGNLNTIENGTVTLALVTGWSGTAGTSDIDGNNDGTVDATFWTSVLSAVSVRDDNGQTNDRGYGAALGGTSLPDINGARYAGFIWTGVEYIAFELQSGESNPGPYTMGTAWNSSGTTLVPFSGNDLTPGRSEFSFPVTLISFDASLFNKIIQLHWYTASEKSSDRFEIQRSIDGTNFISIGSVKALGNSSTKQRYAFSDQSAKGSIIYYRLKMIDLDGSYQYSGIAKIRLSNHSIAVNNIYPQPAQTVVNIEWNSEKYTQAILRINNLSGRQVFHQAVKAMKGYNLTQLNTHALSRGMYVLSIEIGGERISQQFQKQ